MAETYYYLSAKMPRSNTGTLDRSFFDYKRALCWTDLNLRNFSDGSACFINNGNLHLVFPAPAAALSQAPYRIGVLHGQD
jgi:hypothetical protein